MKTENIVFLVFTGHHREHVGATKQGNSSYAGVPDYNSQEIEFYSYANFLLFWLKHIAADHMSENQQYMQHEKKHYAGLALDDTHLSENIK